MQFDHPAWQATRALGPITRKQLLAGLAVAFGFSLLLMVPVLSHRGWPANHDWTAPVARMSVTLQQWRIGHWMPVWSSQLQYGHGSPLPALYHKTFMILSAAALAVTQSPKAAIVLPTLFCMVTGFAGMALCTRQALRGRFPALWLLAGGLLLASNYATTDWLIRGAFAEFSALALIPWIVWWCLILLMEGRWPRWLGVVVALLALSHSAIALFVVVPLGVCVALALHQWRGRAYSWWLPALQSGAIALVCLLPFVLPMAAMGRFNRTEELVRHFAFTPMTFVFPLGRFLWDSRWVWGRDWNSFTVQLDIALVFLLLAYLAFLLGSPRPRAGSPPETNASWAVDQSVGAFVLGTLMVLAWLQTPSAFWVYETIPGTIYLQFAWRLLAYATVVLVLGAVLGFSRLLQHQMTLTRPGHWSRFACGLLGALTLFVVAEPKMWWHPIQYERITPERMQDDLHADYVAMAEFFPLVDWEPAVDIQVIFDQMRNFLKTSASADCTLARPAVNNTEERRTATWEWQCTKPSNVALPVFAAPGMAVRIRRPGDPAWIYAPVNRTCHDPRLLVALPAGSTEVELRFPNWSRTVKSLFVHQVFDFRRDCRLPPAASRVAGSSRNPPP